MNWARRGFVGLLTALLFVTLLSTAFSTSSKIAFSHPDKIESWLNQSNFYGHFVSNAIDQAKKSANSTEEQGSVTLSDTAVQQAAQSAFSQQLLQKSVQTFLDSNYAWLEGKTARPTFTVDLTQAKQSFAQLVGQYVLAHINSLPVCTPQQEAELGNIQNVDPLNITCRPAQLSAQAEAQLVTQRIQTSDNFLSNPVITANNINPNGGAKSQPYYQKYADLPKAYKWGVRLPYIYAAAALLSMLGILLLMPGRRRGLRRIAIVLAEAGLVLVVVRFVLDEIFKQIERHAFNNANIGQLQQSLTSVLHLAKDQLVKIDFYFGIAYLILALVIFIVLVSTRNRQPRAPKLKEAAPEPELAADKPSKPVTDLPPPRPKVTGPPLPPKKRLVQ
ncbi:MAG TPA: hypothetical protein VLG27_01140 [Candidatus Saccharimonadia bacterium]|nr:hypothetical protein [Candidatus Saccharimonadia bacterium]